MVLCKYKNLFGEVGKGIHSYRICNIAIADVLMTILGAFIIRLFTNYNFSLILLILFLLSIVLHHIFCVKTTVDKFLFS